MRTFESFVSLRGRGGGGGRGEGARKYEKRHWEFQDQEMEVRRAVIRGRRWASKPWVRLSLMVSLLFCTLLMGSSGSGFMGMFSSGSENQAAASGVGADQQLDDISAALLKLGLPLSTYALSMQSRAYSSDSARNAGLQGGGFQGIQGSGDEFGVDDQEKRRVNHPLQRVRNVEGEGDSWRSEVSIYSLASNYNYVQQLWVFRNVCYNGSHLMTPGSEVVCREPEDSAPQSPLTPIPCSNGDAFERRLGMVKETGIPMAEKVSSSWIGGRESITWRNETVSLVNLDLHSSDPGRFLQKVNMLLLLNNASSLAYLDQIEIFMFMTHRRIARILKDRTASGRKKSFHGTYLSTLLSRALQVQRKHGDNIFEEDFIDGGRVELNEPFSAATEEKPLCFRKAILTGTLKGSCWPGGEVVADIVRDHLSKQFETKAMSRNSNDWPYLLCLFGNSTRTQMSSSSKKDLFALLDKKSLGLDVHFEHLTAVDFREQFNSLQLANIILGLYADLTIASTFSRKMSVLIEIIPFKVQDRVHEMQALDSGLIYMAHQCEEGNLQEKDSTFQNQSTSSCMKSSKCKDHFANGREVHLQKKDLSRIQKLLYISRVTASEMGAQNRAREKGKGVHDASSDLVENLIGGRGKCQSFIGTDHPSRTCGTNWISFTSKSRGPITCCY